MAFDIRLMKFGKKVNSTKQPGEGETVYETTLSGTLKDGCSLMNPVIAIRLNNPKAAPYHLNYAHILAFDRYYWIEDWSYDTGVWWAHMREDVLATWRYYIGVSNEYIVRSSAAFDGRVVDTYYPTKTSPTQIATLSQSKFVNQINDGFFVLGIINSDPQGVGGISYYVLTPAMMKNVNETLLGNPEWWTKGITEISEDLAKGLMNPYQYITSCMWLPFEPPKYSDLLQMLLIGWWKLTEGGAVGVGWRLNENPNKIVAGSIAIPKHPQAASRGEYLNGAPYSTYQLDFRPFGYLALDANQLAGHNTLYWRWQVDCIKGLGTLRLSLNANLTDSILVTTAQVGVPIQLAQISSDIVGTIQHGVNAIGNGVDTILGAVTGNIGGIGGGVASTINSIGDAVKSAMPQVTTSGANGSFSNLSVDIELTGTFYTLVDELQEDVGRPLCSPRQVDTLPGFVQVRSPHARFPATADEIDQIYQYMETGFFFE